MAFGGFRGRTLSQPPGPVVLYYRCSEISDPRSILGADTGRRTERLLSFDKLQAWFRTAPLLDKGPRDHCLLSISFSGAAPRCFSVSPSFPLAPRAPSLGELAGVYPVSRREPTFQSFQVSTSASDWGEYGGKLVFGFGSVFWFWWFAFRGLRPPAPLFPLGFPPKTLHKANQLYRFCRLVALRLSTQVVGQFGTALTILQAAPVGDITLCREFVKVILTG